MTTPADAPRPSGDEDQAGDLASKDAPGIELSMSPPGEGSTFEPEEDPGA